MNILTFDIEEWFLQLHYYGNHSEMYKEYDTCLCRILDLLDEVQYKGTFFCVGMLAKEFPQVVRKIADHGHEIGCHSNKHEWLNKKTLAEVKEDTRLAIDALEQCVGKKIKSYRAPAFSIGEDNKWAFEVLAECGIENDASIFPANRELGGFPQFREHVPTLIKFHGLEIKEFPIPTTKVFGKDLAYSGGGFFRLLPLWFVKSRMKRSDYNMCYFHIEDLNPTLCPLWSPEGYEEYFKEPGSLTNRYKRYVKQNVGKSCAMKNLAKLLHSMSFCNLEEAGVVVNWNQVPIVSL